MQCRFFNAINRSEMQQTASSVGEFYEIHSLLIFLEHIFRTLLLIRSSFQSVINKPEPRHTTAS